MNQHVRTVTIAMLVKSSVTLSAFLGANGVLAMTISYTSTPTKIKK